MGGINDIKTALKGHGVRNVTMRYDGTDQVFTVELKDRTMEVRAGSGVQADALAQFIADEIAAVEPMPKLGPDADWGKDTQEIEEEAAPVVSETKLGLMSAPAGGDQLVQEIEHAGEKYELAHDGSPQTLFF